MGRAIDMENDIGVLKSKVDRLEKIVLGMTTTLDEIKPKSTKTKHIDLTEVKNEPKETNDEGNDNSSKRDNKKSGKPKRKSTKSGSSK